MPLRRFPFRRFPLCRFPIRRILILTLSLSPNPNPVKWETAKWEDTLLIAVGATSSKSLRLRRFKSDRDEI